MKTESLVAKTTNTNTVARRLRTACAARLLPLALLLTLPAVLQAQFSYFADNGAITITGYTGSSSAVAIPNRINGLPVAYIADWAFYHNKSTLTSITFPSGIISIGAWAFHDCTRLTSLEIPSSVTSIGEGAFCGCEGLIHVAGANSVTSIGAWAFSGCTRLSSYSISASVTTIGDGAFYGCNLTSVTIPNSVTSLGGAAFELCTRLTSVTIPIGIPSIEWRTFSECYSLTNVTIPDSVAFIGQNAFASCSSLTSVTFGNSVTTIDWLAFDGCGSLRRVYFKGNAPSEIDYYMFRGVTVYYLPWTTGWGPTFCGGPTKLWDALGPSLLVASHSNLQAVASSEVILAGSASDAELGDGGVARVTINGLRATNDTAIGSAVANWSRGVSLTAGTNSFTVVATDTVGNSTTNLIGIVFDDGRPAAAITWPAPNQRWSNEVFLVKGTAKDNVQVAAVWCRGEGEWALATTTNSWANWAAEITLAPGTNVVQAYAVDTVGYRSTTNSVVSTYVVSDRLVVQTTGRGTLSPNYSNAVLEIGKSFMLTATAASGFAFTNWTTCAGEVLTNTPGVRFVMQSNLCLQANFVDVTKPTLAITAPTANQRWSNALFTVKGTVKDNAPLAGVWCQTNGVWGPASLGSGGTNWAINVTLVPGTNTIKACAVDGAGNKSLTNSVNFVYVLSDRLVVMATGPCTLSPNYSNAVLEIGKGYSLTATPGNGFVLSNWVGTVLGNVVVVTNTAKLAFTMQSNLVLQANIIPNPFIPVKGAYNGLFAESGRAQASSGFFTLTLTEKGAYSGSLKQGIKTYSLSGQFDVAGIANAKVLRPGTNAWQLAMALDAAAQRLTGTVSNGVSGGWVADLWANRAGFDTRTNPATQYAGKYTLIIPGTTNQDGTVALGNGYATLSVLSNGIATLSGALADSTNFSQTVSVSKDGQLPTYATLYSGKGSVWGWLLFDTNQPSAALSGLLSWIKPAQPGARYYSGGFTNAVEAVGLRYTPPVGLTNRAIHLTNGAVIFDGGNLSTPFTNLVSLTSSNKVINASSNALSLSLTLSSGLFSGSATVPGTRQSVSFKGALLQNLDAGYGYFLGTNQSGSVYFGE